MNLADKYIKNGWIVVDFPNKELILSIKEELEEKLSQVLGKRTSLELYHEHVEDDQTHIEVQIQMTEFFRKRNFDFVSPLLSVFQQIIGLDISVQVNPYLRMVRPHKYCDNIGYHRDTFYGGSPHELSFFVPFVDLGPRNTMSVISGSHVHAEAHYPIKQIKNADKEVTKGSKKHSLGFLYAPKVMDSSIEQKVEPVALNLGQALIFCLSTVHGAVVNLENVTRWSSDLRLVNTFAPVEMGTRLVSYRPIAQSPASYSAQKYEEANEIEMGLCLSKN